MTTTRLVLLAATATLLAGCTLESPTVVTTQPAPVQTEPVAPPPPAPVAPGTPIEEEPGAFETAALTDLPFVRGYRNANDPCQLVGESRFTSRFLDDSADLVACLAGGGAERELVRETGARAVARKDGYTLFSVPRGGSAAG